MHTVDLIGTCVAVLLVVVCAAVLARQRYMMRAEGGQPVAIKSNGEHWVYGIGRYVGGELRWYRAFGIGTRPSRVLDRSALHIVGHRRPLAHEHAALPATAVVVECKTTGGRDGEIVLAISESGFTGFVSWLESASRSS
jgi:hypothetical protein